jgi:hypothetical protein
MGYIFYTKETFLGNLWRRYMPIGQEYYFALALPAITGFILLLCLPINGTKSDEGTALTMAVEKVKRKLAGNHAIGIVMMAMGVFVSNFIPFLPGSLKYIFTLVYMSSFAGLLYVYFSPSFRMKGLIIFFFILFLLVGAVRTGMFTIVVYMAMTIFSFFFINKKSPLWRKVLVFVLAGFVLIIVQSIKPEYRKAIWRNTKVDKTSFFVELISKRINNVENIITPEYMFPIYYRTNQGFQLARVQNYIPRIKPFDRGEHLFVVIASAFVPRFLWQDKPMAGGQDNMLYYSGAVIKGYATDVGPLGEGYGSFGVTGAIIFMMIVGWFIRFVYKRVFIIVDRVPLLLLWIPVFFYQVSYSGENDTLQLLNSIVKISLFIYLVYKIFPVVFNPPRNK